MKIVSLFFYIALLVPTVSMSQTNSASGNSLQLTRGILIELHPRNRFDIDRSVIGEIVDTQGSPWSYGMHKKKGYDWLQKPVAYAFSSRFKVTEPGPYTFGLFIEWQKLSSRVPRLAVDCVLSACVEGELRIHDSLRSYKAKGRVKKGEQMQLAYFLSHSFTPGYPELEVTLACDNARYPELLDKLQVSFKVKAPFNQVMSDITADRLFHITNAPPATCGIQ